MKKIPLLLKIVIAVILGVMTGTFAPLVVIQLSATFNQIFGSFLSFIVPLIIIGFIVPGIGSLSQDAGKLLGMTTLTAYLSSIIAGIFAFSVARLLYPKMLHLTMMKNISDPSEGLVKSLLSIEIPPIMDVMTALVLSFMIGLGLSTLKSNQLFQVFDEFQSIVVWTLQKAIIPLLPFHIFGIFANMTYAGQVQTILSIFAKVFLMIIFLHIIYLIFLYSVAGSMNKKNPFFLLKTMAPAYFTAVGTQSSAATIPVTLQQAKKAGISERIVDFVIPLCANIHLAGSTITLVSCSMAILFMKDHLPNFGEMFPFILVLGIIMIAAPGVPGGAVMAATGPLASILGFDAAMISLIIALYLAQDSFGTACNVTGDGAIATIVDAIANRTSKKKLV
ncbi:hypothetical protein T233_00930 [Vagococcus lutrae LBD1]|uniref:Sodium:dicarboxylate symporter family protein n=1 Tax=Vagococcus lutrae LBD1 TaxID=1408226 RepID=V6Q5M6_9ENTE|nr:dicarboxylate/amino acid:cation symporter [Vagococcus lutrae]EST90032.1 hypothetical protein T233_00930 [Vagococcus lutrae LBD1]